MKNTLIVVLKGLGLFVIMGLLVAVVNLKSLRNEQGEAQLLTIDEDHATDCQGNAKIRVESNGKYMVTFTDGRDGERYELHGVNKAVIVTVPKQNIQPDECKGK
jgi:hypothetical protein